MNHGLLVIMGWRNLVDNDISWTLFFKMCVSCQLFDFPFLVTQKCPRNVIQNVHEMSPKSVHEMSPN